jgi:cytochrome c2
VTHNACPDTPVFGGGLERSPVAARATEDPRKSWHTGGNFFAAVLLFGAALAGCTGDRNDTPEIALAGADPSRAPALIRHYGCGTCHRIPGVAGARGGVGPPLEGFEGRAYVAGVLPNTPANLIHWLRHPQSVVPGNAMPEMGVTEQDARDLAAFLYSLD